MSSCMLEVLGSNLLLASFLMIFFVGSMQLNSKVPIHVMSRTFQFMRVGWFFDIENQKSASWKFQKITTEFSVYSLGCGVGIGLVRPP